MAVIMERIDKVLASQGALSRREVKEIIKSGTIKVNGSVISNPAFKLDCENDAVELDGQPLRLTKYIYIMLNKPQGVVSASKSEDDVTVVSLVPDALRRKGLFPAGRLDKDTTGFVLITDDGDFAHRILSPKNHIFKTYEARLEHPLGEAEQKMLRDGITLSDGTHLKKSSVKVLESGDNPLVQIKICEGKYHQVKRMFAAVGNRVLKLHRTKMGGLELDKGLGEGECREISVEELKKITE